MLRSMFTAIGSLNMHQYFMDVVADNLSNANTIGYKSSRVTFQDQFAQVMWIGSAPTSALGGINPAQVGLGSRLGAISPNFSQGMLQSTGRNTDLAIQGDGFFVYSDGDQRFYSRDGALDIDAEGYLVNTATGMRIQGWQAIQNGSQMVIDTGLPLAGIQLPLDQTLARATTTVALAGNLDAATAATDPFEVTIGVYDSLGALHSITITFTHSADNTWDWSASGDGATGTGTVTFRDDGHYDTGTGSVTVPGVNGAADTTFTLDFSDLTQFASDSDISIVTQDGLAAGSFSGFYVTVETGEVYGVYSNGIQQLIGQFALTKFANPGGLGRVGQNLYEVGVNSGDPNIGVAGTGGRGSIASGYLEGSNVDLAQEFTNMILAQRGFQASSRVITTSDEMLQELVNIKR